MNESGVVVGRLQCSLSLAWTPWVWYPGDDTLTLLPIPDGWVSAGPVEINDHGEILLQLGAIAAPLHPAVYRPDGTFLVPELPEDTVFMEVSGFNNHGDMVGYVVSQSQEGKTVTPVVGREQFEAFASPPLVPNDINDLGEIVGSMGPGQQTRPFLYRDGALQELDLLPGTFRSGASMISNRSDTIGWGRLDDRTQFGTSVGGFWTASTEPRLLDTASVFEVGPRGINDHGIIVGTAKFGPGDFGSAFAWDGSFTNLKEALDTDLELLLGGPGRAYAVNNAGEVLVLLSTVETSYVAVLRPTNRLTEDVTGDCHIGFDDLTELLGHWGTANRQADIDDDGDVGIGDLLTLLLAWSSGKD